ncbi:DUF2946 domain-containing protein [Bradyrhizobium sp. KB893862 SZCCT0404]|uniref:DUF2946 domain-containing protein n=1 Tax=Bradyrhizobium sp. KB893862 SZCCT0404 TaxID=2807672 RepID=UPI001BA72445|nr:DUF2946 domain-containing protein [Bradyrhizobium sp. KB893862 SZCCT0404]MBR1173361.1 DUF2946 domain-containing protein [Bradyrhizobium sp. KB893862 SZCCT0404]
MRARLQKFLPLVLLALAMQVLAPIAACLAASQAVADPLSAAVICHSPSEQGGLNDRTGTPTAHAGACALCCLAQANASLDSPPHVALAIPFRHAERVVWHTADASAVSSPRGSNAQARAPPQLS